MFVSHNVGVLNTSRLLVALLLVALAGCKTASTHDEKGPPPDWDVTPPMTVIPTNVLAPAPVPAMTSEPAETWIPLHRWSVQRGFSAPVKLWSSPAPTYSLSASNGVFVFETKTRIARFDGIEFWLGFAPQMIDGELYLHSLDFKKNVEPLLHATASITATNRVVVIDPGHGGGNTGTKSVLNGRHEKEFTLDWAMRLAPLLKRNGWQVFLTRTNDTELPLGDRVAFAASYNADLFLSLHFNAAPSGNHQAGIETYCLTPVGLPSSLTREFDDDLAAVFPNNAFDIQNIQYAIRLQRALLAIDGTVDRGVRRARFMGVLRGQNRPAVLLEAGYLSNPAEAARIDKPEYRQKLAEAIAAALQ